MVDKLSIVESRVARMHSNVTAALYAAAFDTVSMLHEYRDLVLAKDEEIRNLKKRLRDAEESVKKMSEG